MLYALQQAFNGVTVGSTYALLAMGFTLIMGVVNQINLAHGELLMIGAFVATITFLTLEILGIDSLVLVLVIALTASIASTAAYGLTLNRIVFRPLAYRPGFAPLIATIGVAIFLQEFVRLVQTSGNLWIQPLIRGGFRFEGSGTFFAFLSYAQIAIVMLTVVVLGLYWLLVTRTKFGRVQRAAAQDPGMAALLGLDVRRTVAASFAIAGALAAIAGFAITVRYGVVSFYLGFMLGLKAFTAAVLGGIGSLAGAALGGMILGLVETAWSAYFPFEYRDVVTFGILIAVIVLRPDGIMGRPTPETIPGAGAARR